MVNGMVSLVNQKGLFLAVKEWTVPVYQADASTVRHSVSITASWTSFRTFSPVPIPSGAAPDPQGDGHLAVIDPSTGCEYDFWQARRTDSRWSASWGNSVSLNGDGSFPGGVGARGSGLALTAGLVRPEELRAGRIHHALIMVHPYTRKGGYVAPATKTDGSSTRPDSVPMGTRIQLDPSLDLDTLGLTPYEKTLARAMQEYGIIVGDTGGTLSFFAVHPQSYPTNPYTGILPDRVSVSLPNIPVNRFRVIASGPESTAPSRLVTACGAHR
jgi:hypothetical protein